MATLKEIRDRYGVPAKRGMKVEGTDLPWAGTITSASKHGYRLRVRDAYGYLGEHHPYDLDYILPNEVVRGDDLKRMFDQRIDVWNAHLNNNIPLSHVEVERWYEEVIYAYDNAHTDEDRNFASGERYTAIQKLRGLLGIGADAMSDDDLLTHVNGLLYPESEDTSE